MEHKYSSYIVEVHEDENRSGFGTRYYAYVIGGKITTGGSGSTVFTKGERLFEISLNGPGESKAKAKAKKILNDKGLIDMVLADSVLAGAAKLKVREAQIEKKRESTFSNW